MPLAANANKLSLCNSTNDNLSPAHFSVYVTQQMITYHLHISQFM